ncbi:helix-turn-helix domain-containing protein [Arthrobacter gandavensis]|uniref:GlxA family transcriptional regulator n=1 Tax=Arthrobacter gandavensis TaxID=169960 RepID=UPI00188F1AEA|nr:helix-turn-helix domain-containing protein [Arthrobacter gandavensis]MBF4993588.1 helix-turn-helix domain-containing protein [Arthrobacter gandavensis]
MLKSVALIALENTGPFELGLIAEIFGIDRSARGTGVPRFDFRMVTHRPGPVRTSAGYAIQVDNGLEAAADADLVVMAPYGRWPDGPEPLPPAVLETLRNAHARSAWVMSVCTGAFALAEAGILDGRKAATHWRNSALLARMYPSVEVNEDVLYVQDGNVLSSAGTAAGIDASLHLVRQELGAKAAAAIARDMVVPPHRDGGQAQYIDRPLSVTAGDTLAEVLVWIAANLEQDHSVGALAARAHMSERTFARRLKAETGTTPGSWINAQRVLKAQELLEDTGMSVDEVSRAVGFGQAVLLRHHFNRAVGISPAAYRRVFRGRADRPAWVQQGYPVHPRAPRLRS